MDRLIREVRLAVVRNKDTFRERNLPFNLLIAGSIFGYALSLISSSLFSVLTLTPSDLFTAQLWRLLSFSFVGHNLLILAWTVASLHFGVRLLEQANDNARLLKTFAITQVGTALVVCVLSVFIYAMSNGYYSNLLYKASLCGFAPSCAAVLVLIKQFLPDSIVLATPAGRIKYTHLPLNGCIFAGLASLIGIVKPVVALEVLIGTQLSWTYLRFIAPHDTDDVSGDPAEHFAWATLFPSAFRPFCTIVSRVTFRTLVRAHVCKRRQVRHVDVKSLLSGEHSSPLMSALPAVDASTKDAERRRQKALQALNERLRATRRDDQERIDWDDEEGGEGEDAASRELQEVRVEGSASRESSVSSPSLASSHREHQPPPSLS